MTGNGETTDPKSNAEGEKPSFEQLVDLLVYAPVGLLYEHQDVLPKLVRRGKSQVQLAKVMSQMAAKQGQSKAKDVNLDPEQMLADVLGQAASVLAKGITEIGQAVGLAPTEDGLFTDLDVDSDSDSNRAGSDASPVGKSLSDDSADVEDSPTVVGSASAPLAPIAGYDALKAREIVPLLEDLTDDQRARVRSYELGTRARKTILSKLDKLGS